MWIETVVGEQLGGGGEPNHIGNHVCFLDLLTVEHINEAEGSPRAHWLHKRTGLNVMLGM